MRLTTGPQKWTTEIWAMFLLLVCLVSHPTRGGVARQVQAGGAKAAGWGLGTERIKKPQEKLVWLNMGVSLVL